MTMTMTDESVRIVADKYIARDGTSPAPDGAKLSVDDLLSKAKAAIGSGTGFFHDAAEYISRAQLEGATQRAIAAKVGKSAAWVNRLLAWRNSGFIGDAAFSSQSSKRRVQHAEQNAKPAAAADREYAEAPRYDAAQGVSKQRYDARRPDFDFEWFSAELKKATDKPAKVGSTARDTLVKMLGMLGSSHENEVLTAARAAEKQRRKLGLSWDQLIVAAAPDTEQDIAA